MRRAPSRWAVAALAWASCQVGPAFAETLDMLVATQTGASGTTNNSMFSDALCLSNPFPTRDLLVVASFSSETTGSGTSQVVGDFRLSGNGAYSIAHSRFLNGGSDQGVGNLAWIFRGANTIAPNICLQHKDDGARRFNTRQITLTAIPLDTATVSLDWGHGTGSGFSTGSTSFVTVPTIDPDTTNPVAVHVDNVSLPKAVLIAASLSSSVALNSSAVAEWRLQYRNLTDAGPWTDVGTPIARTLSGSASSNDNGIVQIYAIAELLDGDKDYGIRLQTRVISGGAVNTDTASLAAVSLAFDQNGGGYFPWFQDTVANATKSNNSLAPIDGLDAAFMLDAATDVFVAMSLDGSTTTPGNADGTFEICIEDSGGSFVFGEDSGGDSQEVNRAFQNTADVGAMGVVGVWQSTTTGSFTAQGCWSVTGQPIMTTDPNLVGIVGESTVATVPVTLSYFRADGGGGLVRFEWMTVTETGNVGFNLYVKGALGDWERINEEPIRSKVVDSVVRQRYGYEAVGVEGEVFGIEDVDIFGVKRMRGPFELGRKYGRAGKSGRKIDWRGIGKKHEEKKRARKERKREKMKRKLERKQRELETSAVEVPWLNRAVAVVASAFIGVASAAEPETDPGLLNLEVRESGVHRVTHEELLLAGVDLTGVRVRRIGLSMGGEPVPVRVHVGTVSGKKKRGGRFGPGGYLEFVGEPLDTLYTDRNVYVLRLKRSAEQAVEEAGVASGGAAEASYYLETVRVEAQSRYSFSAPNGDPWYASQLLAWGGSSSRDFVVAVDEYVAGAAPATVTVGLWGWADFPVSPDHHVLVRVNGVEVAEAWFDGLVDRPVEAELPELTLEEGTNTVTVILPNDTAGEFDLVALDSYGVTYPRRFVARDGRLSFRASGEEAFEVEGLPDEEVVVYRVDADGGVVYLSGVETVDMGGTYRVRFGGTWEEATYHVSAESALHGAELMPSQAETDITSGEASYVMISHPDFMGTTLDWLVGMREAQGYTVKVVDVEDIYAQFGHGVPGAQPIKDYIAYAQGNLGTEMVLLVGGDSYDYLDHLGQGAISFIPTPYAQTGAIVRFAPVDALYADVDGDRVPDVALGRLPVRTEGELETWINRSAAWAQRDYGTTAVFAADEYDVNQGYSFSADSEHLIDTMPAGWSVTRAYMDEQGTQGAHDALMEAINGGVALTSFFGHSSYGVWSFDNLLTSTDVSGLENYSRPTVVTQWGCWNTYYVSPTEDTMGHEFLLNGDRGAVAVLGASTLTEAAAEREMSTVLFEYLLSPGMTIGDAMLQAKRDYAEIKPDQLDIILGWSLLGDPAISFDQP